MMPVLNSLQSVTQLQEPQPDWGADLSAAGRLVRRNQNRTPEDYGIRMKQSREALAACIAAQPELCELIQETFLPTEMQYKRYTILSPDLYDRPYDEFCQQIADHTPSTDRIPEILCDRLRFAGHETAQYHARAERLEHSLEVVLISERGIDPDFAENILRDLHTDVMETAKQERIVELSGIALQNLTQQQRLYLPQSYLQKDGSLTKMCIFPNRLSVAEAVRKER